MKTPVLIATPLRSFISAEESLSPHLRRLLVALAITAVEWSFDFACYAGGNVARGRNKLVATFLRSTARYIIFLDDDIEPSASDLCRLLDHRKHVVGALYTTREDDGRLVLNPYAEAMADDATGLLPIGEIGAGCKVYHRSVFEYLIKHEPSLAYRSDEDGNPEWGFFSMGVMEVDGKRRWLSEDYWLDQLCRKHRIPVYADTRTRVKHRDQKTKIAYPPGNNWPEIPQPYVPPVPPPIAEDFPLLRQPGRLVIALQFWEGDKANAMRLARFIAQLEPIERDDVIFCFFPRFDCEMDSETLDAVAAKFTVALISTHPHVPGYPASPNLMATGVMIDAAERSQPEWADVKAVLLLEADCVPLAANWINQLMDEWDRCAAAGKSILGSWRPQNGKHGHINGNLMFDPGLALIVNLKTCPKAEPWDVHFASAFAPHWMRTGLIANRYREILVTGEQLCTPECGTRAPLLVHGIKDESAWNYAQTLIPHECIHSDS